MSSGGHSADPVADDDSGGERRDRTYRLSLKNSRSSVAAFFSPTAE